MELSGLLGRLRHVRKSGAGFTALCPSHRDTNNSLSIGIGGSGALLLKCFAGCEVEAICVGLGVEIKELFPERAAPPARVVPLKPPPTVTTLAVAKRLPEAFLRSLDIEEEPDGTGVAIPYGELDGSTAARFRIRKSLSLKTKDPIVWGGPKGVAVTAYGLWKLKDWR